MELTNSKQVFNLWDTNGRRADILNAIEVYLEILINQKEEFPDMQWGSYPSSLSQYRFYKSAIEASPEVFKRHGKYDDFIQQVSTQDLIRGANLGNDLMRILDESIEQRARHYSSNLVRLGFATENREVTAAGRAYYHNSVDRDEIEEVFPISTTNLLLLRQLLKFKAYTKADENGDRIAYSPLFMALYVLLSGQRFDKADFKTIVQSLTPYEPKDPDEVIEQCLNKDYSFARRSQQTPDEFSIESALERNDFNKHITSSKNKERMQGYYYHFYQTLFDYWNERSEANYKELKEACSEQPAMLKRAFGNGHNVFDFGRQFSCKHDEFAERNENSPFLRTRRFNETFYAEYMKSKIVDQARENSDTTARLFAATGLISLRKALPELVNADIYELVFNRDYLRDNIFTRVSCAEYENQMELFGANSSMCDILGLSERETEEVLNRIAIELGTDKDSIRDALKDRNSIAFKEYVQEQFSADRVSALLKGFSDIDGGAQSRDEINPACGIPTAYEYIVALAWYYISDEEYDLYSSMNLTLGADFEPERFAPGGEGDIVAVYDDMIVMLEATMMNARAQKRSEWEPVLRHSVNLRVDYAPKETTTIFVANELDFNTINIWRAVAMVPLKATGSDDIVNGVSIMPLTSNELADLIDAEVTGSKLISIIKDSFSTLSNTFDDTWRDSIISASIANE